MSKSQLLLLSFSSVLFLILYFGFDTKTKAQKNIENDRVIVSEATSIESLLLEAKRNLQPDEASSILLAEAKLAESNDETNKTEAYKSLSSAWYKINRFAIAGFYAEQVAETEATDEAWSIAGATYNRGMNLEQVEKVKDFCTKRAVQAFENAVSLNPTNVTHKANLAVCYAERPPQDNPMKGVKMLLDLNTKHPDNVAVLTSLGRFGLQTGQFEKAAARLEKALQSQPDNIKVNCLLAQAYQGLGQLEKAKTFQDICQSLAQPQR